MKTLKTLLGVSALAFSAGFVANDAKAGFLNNATQFQWNAWHAALSAGLTFGELQDGVGSPDDYNNLIDRIGTTAVGGVPVVAPDPLAGPPAIEDVTDGSSGAQPAFIADQLRRLIFRRLALAITSDNSLGANADVGTMLANSTGGAVTAPKRGGFDGVNVDSTEENMTLTDFVDWLYREFRMA